LTLVVDTSGVLAYLARDEPQHERVRRVVEAEEGPFLLSPFVLAELDYLVAGRLGRRVQSELLRDVEDGAYSLEPFDADDVRRARAVLERFADHDLGLADASVVVLAERHATTRVLTLDERHFRALRAHDGRAFTLLPADA
jgi:predicted nucleic acid-binding protein